MRSGWNAMAAAAGAALLAACAGGPAPNSEPAQIDPQFDPSVISEVGPPRDRARAHTNLAAAYYEAGNISVALDEVRIAIAADGNYAPAHNVRGLLHMDLKENSQAEASFQRALQIAPTDPDANHNYGWFLCQTGREAQGIKFFLAAVRNPLYSTPEKSFTQAGICAMRINDDRSALENLTRAVRLQPNYLSAVLPLAHLHFKNGDLGQAKQLITQFNRAVEPSAESLWLAVRVERRLGDRSAETGYAEQLKRRFPSSPEFQSLQKGVYE